MRPVSFRAALTLRWSVTFGAILALASAATYPGTRTFLLADLDTQLKTLALTERASMSDAGLHIHDDVQDTQTGTGTATKFVQVLDASGQVLLASRILGHRPALISPTDARAAVQGQTVFREAVVNQQPGRLIVLPMRKDTRSYALVVGVSLEGVSRTLNRLAWLLTGIAGAGLVATGLAGIRLATRTLRPIAHITERAAAIARGQFDARLEEPPAMDEIGQMTALLNDMLDRLRAALAANRRFAADAAHELRSPLTAMLGEIDVTLRRPRTESQYRDSLTFVRDQTEQLGLLFENLLLLVKAQEGEPPTTVHVRLGEVVAEEVARLTTLAAIQGVTLTTGALPPLIVRADRPLLARALDYVLRNAIRYNQPGGTVTVSLEAQPGPTPDALVAQLLVTDTGCGIPAADHERVFERFYRTDVARSRHTGGTGLGLPIAREVLRVFGGTIRIRHSTPGEGTTVELRLPAQRA